MNWLLFLVVVVSFALLLAVGLCQRAADGDRELDRADRVIDKTTRRCPALTVDEVDRRLDEIQETLWPSR